jgi:hypothetical protein
MKAPFKKSVFGLLYILVILLNASCSGDKERPELYSWNDIVGFYATQPERMNLGYDWSVYYSAYALKIEEHVLTDCGAIDNSDLIEGYIDSYCTELKGGWYSDLYAWDIYGLIINGSSVDLYSGTTPIGRSIDIYNGYIMYKGRKYYPASYFNQHVDDWTNNYNSGNNNGSSSGDSNISTPVQKESVSVSISARTISSNRFSRKYEITVKATGSNFTVQQIGLERVSGLFVPTSIYTSSNQYTFTETYTSSSSSTICGYVKTSSGKTYRTSNITLSK